MKYSRNPKTGILECYTDDGKYLGKVYGMTDLSDDHAEDQRTYGEDEEVWRTSEEGKHFKFESETGEIKAGFGGRFNGMKLGTSWRDGGSVVGPPKPPEKPKEPGKPSGSPDGQKHWISGLSPEKREKAAGRILGWKENMKAAKADADTIEELTKQGLSKQERDNLLKRQKLDKFNENMSVEEFVMACKPFADKKELTDMMTEAAGWPRTAEKMMDERLSEDEKKIVDYFKEKYGDYEGVPIYATDYDDDWDITEAEVWMDLKSKALGGPVSGNKIPTRVLAAAGALDLSKPLITGPAKALSSDSFPPTFKKKSLQAFLNHVNSVQDRDPEVSTLYAKVLKMWDSVPPTIDQKISYTEKGHKFGTKYYATTGRLVGISLAIPKMADSAKTHVEAGTTAHEIGHLMDFLAREGDTLRPGEFTDKYRTEFGNLLKKWTPPSEETKRLLDDVEKKARDAGNKAADKFDPLETEKNSQISEAIAARDWRKYESLQKERDKIWRDRDKAREDAIRDAAGGYGAVWDIFNALGDRQRLLGHTFGMGGSSRLHECWANWCELSMAYPEQRKLVERELPEFSDLMKRMTREMVVKYTDD